MWNGQVTYDPRQVSYAQLLAAFWGLHDATQLNRQGNDVGTQYRSGIYVHSAQQREVAVQAVAKQQEQLQVMARTCLCTGVEGWVSVMALIVNQKTAAFACAPTEGSAMLSLQS